MVEIRSRSARLILGQLYCARRDDNDARFRADVYAWLRTPAGLAWAEEQREAWEEACAPHRTADVERVTRALSESERKHHASVWAEARTYIIKPAEVIEWQP